MCSACVRAQVPPTPLLDFDAIRVGGAAGVEYPRDSMRAVGAFVLSARTDAAGLPVDPSAEATAAAEAVSVSFNDKLCVGLEVTMTAGNYVGGGGV